jgi:hypothetical protein
LTPTFLLFPSFPSFQELGLDGLKGRHWRCAGCSAVAGEGLRDAFLWLVADVAERIYMLD